MKTFKQHLEEAKQVGVIYHFTNVDALISILEKDTLSSEYHHAIAFTRNYKLGFSSGVRIAFDGDKMSNKFSFEPKLYKGDLKYKKEAEETIRKNSIKGVIKYIKQVDVIPEDLGRNEGDLFYDFMNNNTTKVNIKVVDDWMPVK